MELHIALHYLFLESGIKILKDQRIINKLDDYGVFKEKPYRKYMLAEIVRSKFLDQFFAEHDKSMRDALVEKFIYKTGFARSRTFNLIKIIHASAYFFSKQRNLRNQLNHCSGIERANIKLNGLIYTQDCKMLIGVENDSDILEIAEGCIAIGKYALESSHCRKLHIPSTIKYIADYSLPIQDYYEIINDSPYFKYENDLLLSADGKRLIRCLSESPVLSLPQEVVEISPEALNPTLNMECGDIGYSGPPYILKINSDSLKVLQHSFKYYAVSSVALKETFMNLKVHLIDNYGDKLCNISPEDILVDNLFVDKYGVVYTHDKKTLLCYPNESSYKEYHILEECETIAKGAFVTWFQTGAREEFDCSQISKDDKPERLVLGLPSPFHENDDTWYVPNCLEILKLPCNLKYIADCALDGLKNLKTIKIEREHLNRILEVIVKYDSSLNASHVLGNVDIDII